MTAASFKNLPPLAGLCSFDDAMRPGLSVEACVTRLKRFHYAFKRLHFILTSRLTSEPIYELKNLFSHHAFLCAEHVTSLRRRVGEMREPPLGLDQIPDPFLEVFFDEIQTAPTTESLVFGLYAKALPALHAAIAQHQRDTNPLADQPSIRLLRFASIELEDMLQVGSTVLDRLNAVSLADPSLQWVPILDALLLSAGGLDGTRIPSQDSTTADSSPNAAPAPIPRLHSQTPYRFDPVPKRDVRFPDPYNMGVNAEVFLYDPAFPPAPKTLMMFYKRIREIDVPEMMASIIAETPDKPWDYYRDMTRQLWDEARHAMMGEVGFVNLGIDWSKVMVNFTWSLALNTQLTPIERHAVLYFIEQGLMPKTGKRFEWEVGIASQNPLAATFQDYDWADEVLHAKIGRDWYVKEFSDPKESVQYGDECWSKVLMGWKQWRDQGLTQHRNWWPDLYLQACKAWGITPDPKVLAYNTSYEAVRADLKNL